MKTKDVLELKTVLSIETYGTPFSDGYEEKNLIPFADFNAEKKNYPNNEVSKKAFLL